jgi:hypothetical protein
MKDFYVICPVNNGVILTVESSTNYGQFVFRNLNAAIRKIKELESETQSDSPEALSSENDDTNEETANNDGA